MDIQRPKLDDGKIEELTDMLRATAAATSELRELIRTEIGYFERNKVPMHYPEFRNQHLFAGSGVIEAGCRTVIGQRLKQSGMFWTVRGANDIIALRCCHLSGRTKIIGRAAALLDLPLLCRAPPVLEGSNILRDEVIVLTKQKDIGPEARLRRIEVWLEDKQDTIVLP